MNCQELGTSSWGNQTNHNAVCINIGTIILQFITFLLSRNTFGSISDMLPGGKPAYKVEDSE